jgi:hypothetical protein
MYRRIGKNTTSKSKPSKKSEQAGRMEVICSSRELKYVDMFLAERFHYQISAIL